MEKITIKFIHDFIADNDISFTATQTKLCVPIINRLCQKMAYGIKFDDIKVCDNLVIDGHHRYLSSLITGFNIGQVNSHKTSGTKSIDWVDVEFVEDDWDTLSKIAHLNELDAIYNDLDLQIVKQIASVSGN